MCSHLTINFGQYSEKGCKPLNEDACGIKIPEEPLLTSKGVTVVIADGVSSSEGGREASEACVKGLISDYYSTPESWTVKTSAQKVLGALNRWLYGQGHHIYGSELGMLTTLSAIIIKSNTAHLFHVGDTRIFRIQDNEIECLTRDHQMWETEKKTYLCRAMGADVNIDIDYKNFPVEIGDVFILTTDGVHEFVSLRDLKHLALENGNNFDRCAKLISTKALHNGSKDNVTCQILKIENIPLQDKEELYRQLAELPFPPPFDNGMVIDGYKVLRELHSSKRTQVYLALDSISTTKVVLKTPSVNFEDDFEYISRFVQEEWIGRRIENPHVIRVLDSNRRKRFLYYVTEYLEGATLRQMINDHPQFSLNMVRSLVEQIISGLRSFHRLEMIHQDLKPENILVDIHGVVKIIDFGSTKIAGIQEISTPIEYNKLLGTLDYAAPEYFQGLNGTNRSDIYSLGVVVYEMLSGRLPYGQDMSLRKFKNVQYSSLRNYNSDIPQWLDQTIQKAVCIDPMNRYATLSEFQYDLNHPNQEFIKNKSLPLLESNPLLFWKWASLTLFMINWLLLYFLFKN